MKRLTTLLVTIGFAVVYTFADNCTAVNASYLAVGQADWGDMSTQDDGSGVWHYDSSYGAKAMKQGGHTGYLFTPTLNFSGAESVTLTFQHAHKFSGTPSEELTLWVTSDWHGSFDASTWTQLIIDPYAANTNWTFVSVSIDVPVVFVGSNTVFAFKYMSTASAYATWEIKNLEIESTCPTVTPPTPTPTASPVPVPSVGNARLKVCGQNLRNYYYYFSDNDRPDYTTQAGFAEKTRKIVDALMWVDADIYAFNEVEARPIVLQQLADSMNARVEGTPYAAVNDYIDVPSSTRTNNIKSGFIYRTDKVQTYGMNYAGSTNVYYRETMRIQAFQEISSGQRFTLSMSHFKAKDNSDDAGNSMRVNNANQLLTSLNSSAADPDILIMGDLNCEPGEQPITIIENAGYTEQLLRFDATAYSHCYYGTQLIDHALANNTMASQITGAGVYHICTSCGDWGYLNYDHRYSDHDAYIIGINLAGESSYLTNTQEESIVRKLIENGQLLIILPDGSRYSATGQRIK